MAIADVTGRLWSAVPGSGVQMHVVPSVRVEQRAVLGALEPESGLVRHTA